MDVGPELAVVILVMPTQRTRFAVTSYIRRPGFNEESEMSNEICYPALDLSCEMEGTQLHLHWDSYSDEMFAIEHSVDMLVWTTIQEHLEVGYFLVDNPTGFYRIRLEE